VNTQYLNPIIRSTITDISSRNKAKLPLTTDQVVSKDTTSLLDIEKHASDSNAHANATQSSNGFMSSTDKQRLDELNVSELENKNNKDQPNGYVGLDSDKLITCSF